MLHVLHTEFRIEPFFTRIETTMCDDATTAPGRLLKRRCGRAAYPHPRLFCIPIFLNTRRSSLHRTSLHFSHPLSSLLHQTPRPLIPLAPYTRSMQNLRRRSPCLRNVCPRSTWFTWTSHSFQNLVFVSPSDPPRRFSYRASLIHNNSQYRARSAPSRDRHCTSIASHLRSLVHIPHTAAS